MYRLRGSASHRRQSKKDNTTKPTNYGNLALSSELQQNEIVKAKHCKKKKNTEKEKQKKEWKTCFFQPGGAGSSKDKVSSLAPPSFSTALAIFHLQNLARKISPYFWK